MLAIWSTTPSAKVLSMLSPVLQRCPDLPVQVVADYADLAALQPTAVFALGKEPFEAFHDLKLVGKGKKSISAVRGDRFILPSGVPALVSYSPAIRDVDYAAYQQLLTDTTLAARLAATGSTEPALGQYRYVPDFTGTIAAITQRYAETKRPVDCALDLETVGLDEFALPDPAAIPPHPGAYIVSIQISYRAGFTDVVRFASRAAEEAALADFGFVAQLSWLISTPLVSLKGANLKYDLRWLFRRGGLTATNFRFDTTLVGSLLDENRPNGLDVHCLIYAPSLGGYSSDFDKAVDKSRMDLVSPERLLPYAGGDADATLRVAAVQKAELLRDPALTAFYVNILHPAARAFEILERGGVFIDRNAFRELEADLNAAAIDVVHRAKHALGGRLVAKHADPDKAGGLNITKASLITDFMFSDRGLGLKPVQFTEKEHKPSTALDHLLQFRDVPEASEFVGCLAEYGSITKTLGTYVTGFLQHLRSDGRFHPSYWFFVGDKDDGEGGTNTGRLSAKNPAWQTLPKWTRWAKRLRRCYIAPPGYVICEKDYRQGELMLIACIANELHMIDAYRNGMDLHVITSAKFAGYTYAQMLAMQETDLTTFEATRKLGKAGNFGLIYGIGVDGFIDYVYQKFGVVISRQQAEEFIGVFFGLYPGLTSYHTRYKQFAHDYGQVRSPLGRVRHLPMINAKDRKLSSKAERQSVNAPVQSTLSDMLLWATALMVEQHADWYEQEIILPFGANHDAAYDYLREDRVDECLQVSRQVMENLPFEKVGWKPQLNFIADCKLGPNLADLTGVK